MFGRFAQLKEKARARTGLDYPIIVIQEAGYEAFAPVVARLTGT